MRVVVCLLLLGLNSPPHAPAFLFSKPDAGPYGLMVELMARPDEVEISDARPEFSWIVPNTQADDVQSAYEIQVAAGADGAGEKVWESGKILTDRSVAVEYAGRDLISQSAYSWRVRTWNKQDVASPWSESQVFRTGKLGVYSTPRYKISQVEIPPASVTKTGEDRLFIDFGRAAFGKLRLVLNAPPAGERIVVHLGEKLAEPGKIDRKPPGSVRYLRAEMALKPGRHTYEVALPKPDLRLMSPEVGAVMPFRYVELEGVSMPLEPDSIRQIAAWYPFHDESSAFSSSDKRINAIWDLCKYTMKATSFGGVFIDGDRERLPYEADAYINQLGFYACDREFSLSRYSHEYLMDNPTWPPEWKHHSVFMAWTDYLYTGDAESLAFCYDKLKAEKLLADRARADGLLDTKGLRDLVDWPITERDGFEMKPVNTVYNAFYARSLVLMAQIAEALAKSEDARKFQAEAARVTAAFNARLLDPATGLYVDGEGSGHSSLHANMFPLAFGLVPADRKAKVVAFVKSRGMACSVYAAQYLFDALFDEGEDAFARSLATASNDRSWTHMIERVGTTMALEAWDQKYKPNQDWNHAWGAAPANLIPRKLMGIEPIEPGFRKVAVKPRPGGLASAAIDLPTIRGPIHVEFEDAPETFTLNLGFPSNMTAVVYVPRSRTPERDVITVDGRPYVAAVEGDFLVVEPIGSGAHRIERRNR